MADNAYKGEVTVDLDGRAVTLRATWGAMAILARVFGLEWSSQVAEAITYRDTSKLSVILEAMSDGQITVAELMDGQASLTVVNRISEAFRFSYHGMKEPGKPEENPMKPQPTASNMLTRVLSRLGLARTSSGA